MEDIKTKKEVENTKESEKKFKYTPLNVKSVRFRFPKKLHCGHWVEDVKALAWFGRDVEGKYTRDPEHLEYLHIPKNPSVDFDLTLKHKDDEFRASGFSIDGFFQWIVDHHTDINGKAKKIDANFVASRCDLQKLMRTPYENTNGWEWVVMKVKGVTYAILLPADLNESDDEGKTSTPTNSGTSPKKDLEEKCKDKEEISNVKSETISSESDNNKIESNSGENAESSDVDSLYAKNILGRWGSKFEHYLLSPSPGVPPNPDRPLRKYDDFAVAFSAKLGKHKLLYAGEMDGMPDAQAPNDLDNAEFVELKTVNENISDYNFRRHKLLQYWAQNVWVKVKYILLGYRDDNVGVVRNLGRFHLKHLPRLADDLWDPYKCFEYVRIMLNIASDLLRKEKKGTQLQFFWHPNLFKTKSLDMELTIISPHDEKERSLEELLMIKFIPKFYLEWLNENFDDEGNLLEQTK